MFCKNLWFVAAMGGYFLACLGVFSEADAMGYSLVLAFLKPDWIPYLLLALSSGQDAPGLGTKWYYASFLATSLIFLVFILAAGIKQKRTFSWEASKGVILSFSSVMVIVYGMLVSALFYLTGEIIQSSERPFYIVGPLMVLMVTSAAVSFNYVLKEKERVRHAVIVSWMCIANALFVAIMQVFLSNDFYRSAGGSIAIAETAQLTELTFLGFPRITGPYTSPNALALGIAFFFMIIIGAKRDYGITSRFSLFYSATGLLIAFLTLSKAMLFFFILTSLILIFYSFGKKAVFLISGLTALSVFFFFQFVDLDLLMDVFRVGREGGFGYRSQAWDAVFASFGWKEWLFGTGLSYWKYFFEWKLGFSLSDPHTYLISVPGTFGLVGVLFYLSLAAFIINAIARSSSTNRVLGAFLFILIFIKDLVSIPYVFGNTQMTFLLWGGLTLLFYAEKRRAWQAERAQVVLKSI